MLFNPANTIILIQNQCIVPGFQFYDDVNVIETH